MEDGRREGGKGSDEGKLKEGEWEGRGDREEREERERGGWKERGREGGVMEGGRVRLRDGRRDDGEREG